MMIMNRSWNERLMSKASGSHEPRCTKAHSAPATPMIERADTANAESLACSGRMPMISAAMSMSRIAIHMRPMRPRTRFLATSASTATNAEHEQILLHRRVDRDAEQVESATATEPDGA